MIQKMGRPYIHARNQESETHPKRNAKFMFGQVYWFCLIPHLPLILNIWNVFWSMGYSIFRYVAPALVQTYVVPCPSLLKHLKLKIWKCLWVGDRPDTFKAERIENLLFHNTEYRCPIQRCIVLKQNHPCRPYHHAQGHGSVGIVLPSS